MLEFYPVFCHQSADWSGEGDLHVLDHNFDTRTKTLSVPISFKNMSAALGKGTPWSCFCELFCFPSLAASENFTLDIRSHEQWYVFIMDSFFF